MLKKMFVVFLICTFVSNIFALNALAANTQPAVSHAQTEELAATINMLLEEFKNRDLSAAPYPSVFLNDDIERYQLLIEHYLQEITDDDSEIAPGCLPPYTAAFLNIFFLTPILAGFTLWSFWEGSIDAQCVWGSFFGMLVPFTWGLISWIDYRICAEQGSDTPDQETIALLEQDRAFMVRTSSVFLVLTALFAGECNYDLFGGLFADIGRD